MVKMKILHAFDFFSPAHGGGTVDLLYRIARGQTNRGDDVSIYTSDFELDQSFIDSLSGVEVIPFHSWLNIGGFHLAPALIDCVRKNIRKFDIVHMHTFRSFQNIVIHHYARKYGIPYVIDAHGSTPRIAVGKKGPVVFFKWIYDLFWGFRIMRDAGRLIAETRVGMKEYMDLGAGEVNISLVHPPLDMAEFSELPPSGTFRRQFDIGTRKVVLFLGRINWIKGPDFLVKAFAGLVRQEPEALLVIAGPDDGYQKNVEELIAGLGIRDNVIFTGFLGGKDKLAALVDADVLVQPSVYEQGARPSLEAIMCGTPVIVSKNTGAGEDIGQMDAGDLVEYGDTEGMSAAIRKILDNPGEAMQKTDRAREYIRLNLSVEGQVEKYSEIYQEVIEINRKGKNG